MNDQINSASLNPALDQGYKYLIEIILNLNHDRYKSYFNYFTIVNLGIVTAMHADFSKTVAHASTYLSVIGVILGIAWLLVLHKIQKDITQAWKLIRDYENSEGFSQEIKISETGWKGIPASKIMLAVPMSFISFYLISFFP